MSLSSFLYSIFFLIFFRSCLLWILHWIWWFLRKVWKFVAFFKEFCVILIERFRLINLTRFLWTSSMLLITTEIILWSDILLCKVSSSVSKLFDTIIWSIFDFSHLIHKLVHVYCGLFLDSEYLVVQLNQGLQKYLY